jgi:hypothetical protein
MTATIALLILLIAICFEVHVVGEEINPYANLESHKDITGILQDDDGDNVFVSIMTNDTSGLYFGSSNVTSNDTSVEIIMPSKVPTTVPTTVPTSYISPTPAPTSIIQLLESTAEGMSGGLIAGIVLIIIGLVMLTCYICVYTCNCCGRMGKGIKAGMGENLGLSVQNPITKGYSTGSDLTGYVPMFDFYQYMCIGMRVATCMDT